MASIHSGKQEMPDPILSAKKESQHICKQAEKNAKTVASHLISTAQISADLAMDKANQYAALRKEILDQKLQVCNQIVSQCAQENMPEAIARLMAYLDQIGFDQDLSL